MAELTWDGVGEKFYETGVDHGILFLPNLAGDYDNGVAWNGLVTVTESPSGAEASALYADNQKYLNLYSAEEFSATIEAYTYPDEFQQFDGLGIPTPGVAVGQQRRGSFGLCYRTRIGNDVAGDDLGYKLHLVYGCTASPSEKAYGTVNDTPEAITFSWEVNTVPVQVTDMRPTSTLVIDSTKVDSDALADLLEILNGTEGVDPAMPLPDTVIGIFAGTIVVRIPTQPSFDQGTNTITIPAVTGVSYYINDEVVPAGAVVIDQATIVVARADEGSILDATRDNDWWYNYVAP